MSQLRQIKAQLESLRYEMQQEMERAYLIRSAVLRTELEDLVLGMYRNGMSVNAIAREYGTKNWKTVRNILDAALARTSNQASGNQDEIKIEPFTHPDGYPNAYRVTLPTGEVTTVYVPAPGDVRVIESTGGTDVLNATLDRTGQVWDAIYQATKKEA